MGCVFLTPGSRPWYCSMCTLGISYFFIKIIHCPLSHTGPSINPLTESYAILSNPMHPMLKPKHSFLCSLMRF